MTCDKICQALYSLCGILSSLFDCNLMSQRFKTLFKRQLIFNQMKFACSAVGAYSVCLFFLDFWRDYLDLYTDDTPDILTSQCLITTVSATCKNLLKIILKSSDEKLCLFNKSHPVCPTFFYKVIINTIILSAPSDSLLF